MSALTTIFSRVSARLGETVHVWAANKPDNLTYGVGDPAWIDTGTATAIINELTPAQAEHLAGGPVNVKLATLYMSESDGSTLVIGNLVVTASDRVWRVDGEPSQPAAGGHYEARLAQESNPPAEVTA